MAFDALVISCEHASRRVPPPFRDLLRGGAALLRTHRGWDIGAAAVAVALGKDLGAPVFAADWTRLLIDANRSLHHRAVFSAWTRHLDHERRAAMVARLYRPYRQAVEAAIVDRLRGGGRVLHVSVHSFAPRLRGETRRADLGLLYDPARRVERELCAAWREALREAAPQLRVRRNYPYRGTSDGFSVALRRVLRTQRYACVELEVNQALLRRGGAPAGLRRALRMSLASVLRR